MLLIRLGQMLFVFLSAYLTLFFMGEAVYISYNHYLFVFMIVLCFLQPLLNLQWRGKVTYSQVVIIVTLTFFAFSPLYFLGDAWLLISMAILARFFERIFYVHFCLEKDVKFSQKLTLLFYFFEVFVYLISVYFFKIETIGERLIVVFVSYFMILVFVLRITKSFDVKYDSCDSIFIKYFKSFPYAIYYVACIVLLNVERSYHPGFMAIEGGEEELASYIFYINIFSTFFSLASYKFDEVRKGIVDTGKEPNISKVLFWGVGVFGVALGGVLLLNLGPTENVRSMLGLVKIDNIYLLCLYLLYVSIFYVMLHFVFKIQNGKYFKAISFLLFLLVVKFSGLYFFDAYFSNFLVFICVFLFLFFVFISRDKDAKKIYSINR